MATINVATPFTVQLEPPAEGATRTATDPSRYVFPTAGTYNDVPDEVATHPYTLAHLVGYEPPPPPEMMADTVVMTPAPEAPPDPPVRDAKEAEPARPTPPIGGGRRDATTKGS